MWVHCAVCKPFAMIVGSFAINVGLTAFLFAMIASPKRPSFASRSCFVCKPLHIGRWGHGVGQTGRVLFYGCADAGTVDGTGAADRTRGVCGAVVSRSVRL